VFTEKFTVGSTTIGNTENSLIITADSIVYLPGFKEVEEEGKPPRKPRDR
jgi:hypothetical protein